jgi:hypothetical protein
MFWWRTLSQTQAATPPVPAACKIRPLGELAHGLVFSRLRRLLPAPSSKKYAKANPGSRLKGVPVLAGGGRRPHTQTSPYGGWAV